MASLSIRLDLDAGIRVGPGKIRLLEAIAAHGSISAAGRALGMSYRRAWLLVDELNGAFAEPVVAGRAGGRSGGGAAVTPFGERLIACYRGIERDAAQAARERLAGLADALAPARVPPGPRMP
ncbi:winged helix-turn-helix domain-containing protein [Methylobacterium nonmethylotrophicum]|uniref:LysR family transcriptional regulator n=1 Tax=Methylobacterium nonmethylotrophicum TaxID=1141884 RepID=A0A4Z0ND82_9HYPH|nr:LysR family transcriptional regulator [Methylobacterium nonmethylotrophicum]TGD92124.1 LysR family transcriptional regulator [Methylobacterium nonmethylotrophicum]